jgi:hypothetical protein
MDACMESLALRRRDVTSSREKLSDSMPPTTELPPTLEFFFNISRYEPSHDSISQASNLAHTRQSLVVPVSGVDSLDSPWVSFSPCILGDLVVSTLFHLPSGRRLCLLLATVARILTSKQTCTFAAHGLRASISLG